MLNFNGEKKKESVLFMSKSCSVYLNLLVCCNMNKTKRKILDFKTILIIEYFIYKEYYSQLNKKKHSTFILEIFFFQILKNVAIIKKYNYRKKK